MVSHSCSGRNSFVDITSNQAQPLSNFLLIQPDQRHLQILIEVQPATPAKLGERRREDTPVSAGDQTQYSVDLGD